MRITGDIRPLEIEDFPFSVFSRFIHNCLVSTARFGKVHLFQVLATGILFKVLATRINAKVHIVLPMKSFTKNSY